MVDPLLTFYGDDFTGATDALQALSVAGVRTVLCLTEPDADRLDEDFPDVDAVGMAGQSRSMTPEQMDDALPPAFDALADLGAPVLHYKVCSTFDSAPEVGSIGHAIDVAQGRLDSPVVPLAVGAPPLGRYVVFGNHFATMDGETYRLDRHPVMSAHPVTPMDESDLRRHLGEQTDRPIGHVDVLALDDPDASAREAFRDEASDAEIVLFDTLTDEHLAAVGDVVWAEARDRDDADPLVTVGSSGVEYALADRWQRSGLVDGTASFPDLDPVDRLVVMSGSASAVTDGQIQSALDAGFAGVRLDAPALVDPAEASAERDRAVAATHDALDDGDSVVLYSARGPDDPAIDRVEARVADLDLSVGVGARLGTQQGRILRRILAEADVSRACVAGGDTCGYVTPELDVDALETLSPTAPGCPLCLAHARTPTFDGLQIALKSGQLGQTDYFERVRRGA